MATVYHECENRLYLELAIAPRLRAVSMEGLKHEGSTWTIPGLRRSIRKCFNERTFHQISSLNGICAMSSQNTERPGSAAFD